VFGGASREGSSGQGVGSLCAGDPSIGGWPLIGWLGIDALAAVETEVLEGSFSETASVIRAAYLAGRRVFLTEGIHPDKLGSLFLHGIETSLQFSLL
jgi:hypothetical protein